MTEYTSARGTEEYCCAISSAVAPWSKANDGVESHPGSGNPDHALRVGVDRDPLNRFGRVHVGTPHSMKSSSTLAPSPGRSACDWIPSRLAAD
jgi:hypothetical protein